MVAVAIGLPMAYLVSFGPACWVSERRFLLRSQDLSAIYRPLIALASDGYLRGPILWYAGIGASSNVPRIERGRIRWETPLVDLPE